MALQDNKQDTRRQAARVLTAVLIAVMFAVLGGLLAVLGGCATGQRESGHARRMSVYREFYNQLTPLQRRQYLAGEYGPPESARSRLRELAEANRRDSSLLGRRDLKTSAIEKTWDRAEEFLASAQERAKNARELPGIESDYSKLQNELKRCEGQIRHTPYPPAERRALLQKNAYYVSRMKAIYKLISKSDPKND